MKHSIIISIAICLLICGAVFSADTDTTTVTKIGQIVPDFTFQTDGGKTLTMQDLRGKVVLINFFATWCPPCKKEMPELEKEWNTLKGKDFYLVSIGREETMKKVIKFKEEYKLSFPVSPDPDRGIFSQFATVSIPRNVIVNKKSEIIYQGIGYSEEEFKHMIDLIKKNLKNI